MYVRDFPKANGAKDAVGPCKWRASQDNGTDVSSGLEWVGVIRYEGMEHLGVLSCSEPSSQPDVEAFYVMKIVSS